MRLTTSDLPRAAALVATTPPSTLRTVLRVRSDHLTYLSTGALLELGVAVRRIDREGVPGSIIETGTALGGSGLLIAKAKAPARELHLYDMFGMIPPPSDADGPDVHDRYERILNGESHGIAGETYYGYRGDLLDRVQNSFVRYRLRPDTRNILFHKGLFEHTLNVDKPVALAHLDGDWYESTKVGLERVGPWMSSGGRIVIDDYFTWSGCKVAVDEFLAADKKGRYKTEKFARLHIVIT